VNTVATILILLSPAGLVYAWAFYWVRMKTEPGNWRGNVTLASLVLASVAILLWPICRVLMPRADWQSGAGVGHQVQWVDSWEKCAVRILLIALILCFFGRPRLIMPIAVACVGAALFWDFSNMP
jgi:hypothetical protein